MKIIGQIKETTEKPKTVFFKEKKKGENYKNTTFLLIRSKHAKFEIDYFKRKVKKEKIKDLTHMKKSSCIKALKSNIY